MFFPRLRRQAKWVFIFLALIFAGGFVFFGVGSGHTGIGSLFGAGSNSHLRRSSSGLSVDSARDRLRKNPDDPTAYRQLASALLADGRDNEAIATLRSYTARKPRDVEALSQLAVTLTAKASRLQNEARLAQFQAQALTGASFGASPSSALGRALGPDPIVQAISSQANSHVSRVFGELQFAFQQAISTYGRIARLEPADPQVQIQLAQTAAIAGDARTAIAAYQKFIKLAPDDSSVPAVKQQIRQLRSSLGASTPSG